MKTTLNTDILNTTVTETVLDAQEATQVWAPVHAISGYSGRFEDNITVIVFRNSKTGKFSSQPFSCGVSLGNPALYSNIQDALAQARSAFC